VNRQISNKVKGGQKKKKSIKEKKKDRKRLHATSLEKPLACLISFVV
jgi:hypothetical protein